MRPYHLWLAVAVVASGNALAWADVDILFVGDSFWANSTSRQFMRACLAENQVEFTEGWSTVGGRQLLNPIVKTNVTNAVQMQQPDVVAIQLGLNDIIKGASLQSMLGGWDEMVQAIRGINPKAHVFFSTITPFTIDPTKARTTSTVRRVVEYNNRLVERFANRELGSRVTLVDTWSAWNGSPTGVTNPDGLHPNSDGHEALSTTWCEAISQMVAGDFNSDGLLDVSDVDVLSEAIHNGINDSRFDINDDGRVGDRDLAFWVHDLMNTVLGDANLDGTFGSRDLVQVIRAGQYEDSIENNSGWAQGDWDADRDFTSHDFTVALIDGGYNAAAIRSAAVVPEPSSSQLVMSAIVVLLVVRFGNRFGSGALVLCDS